MMVLDIYDILKKVRKGTKINRQLTRIDVGAPHASDESIKQYQIIDHRSQKSKNVIFKLNKEMNTRQLTVVEQIDL